MKIRLAILAALLLLLTALVWRGQQTPPPSPPRSATRHDLDAADAARAVSPSDAALDRVDAGAEAPSSTAVVDWLAHPYRIELDVFFVDDTGLPLSGQNLELGVPGGPLLEAPLRSGNDGHAVVVIPSRTPDITLEVLDPRQHRRLLQLTAVTTNRITLLHPRQRDRGMRFRLFLGTPGKQASHALAAELHPDVRFSDRTLATVKPPSNPTTENTTVSSISFDPKVQSHGIVTVGEFAGAMSFSTSNLHLPDSDSVLQDLSLDRAIEITEDVAVTTTTTTMNGYAFAPDGKPATGQPVALLHSDGVVVAETDTDGEGAFSIADLPAGSYTLRVGGYAEGLATTTTNLTSGVTHVDVQLDRGATIQGVLKDHDDQPIPGAQLDWHADDGTWADRSETRADGTFVFANMKAGTGTLTAWTKDSHRLPLAVLRGVRADTGTVELRAPPATGAILLRIDPESLPERPVLRLRHLTTGFSRPLRHHDAGDNLPFADGQTRAVVPPEETLGIWVAAHLAAGDYAVEVVAEGVGHHPLPAIWITEGRRVDLGHVVLPAPGRIHFEALEGDEPTCEIVALRPDYDVRLEVLPGLQHDVWIPPGDYALATQHGELPPTFERFTVERGRTTTVVVPR